MSQNDLVVCENCGEEAVEHTADKHRADADGCAGSPAGRVTHDWSDADPLSRLEARVDASADMTVVDSADSDGCQWVEVDCSGRDAVGDSEVLSNWTADESFSFNGIGSGDNCVRFNRAKSDD